jgi:vacuolar-type H+-ATPase subunit B/Vma2
MMVPLLNHRIDPAVSNQYSTKMIRRKMAMNISIHMINQRHRVPVFKASGLTMAEMNAGTSPRAGSTDCDAMP